MDADDASSVDELRSPVVAEGVDDPADTYQELFALRRVAAAAERYRDARQLADDSGGTDDWERLRRIDEAENACWDELLAALAARPKLP